MALYDSSNSPYKMRAFAGLVEGRARAPIPVTGRQYRLYNVKAFVPVVKIARFFCSKLKTKKS